MEGWVLVVTNIHEEALEEDVMDLFMEYGKVQDLHLNLDRRTGFVKVCVYLYLARPFSWFVRISDRIQGYALIQYKTQQEAENAIDACKRGLTLLEQPLDADYAFVQPPKQPPHARGGSRRPARERSLSPMRH